jgi:ABC-type maltose transport system permease subunit
MENEWKMDLDIPDIGSLITLLSAALAAAIMGVGNVLYVVIMVTTAYEAKGKEFLLSLIDPQASLTFEAQFVLVVGTLLIISAIFFFITMLVSVYETHAVSKKERGGRIKIVFACFIFSMFVLILALLYTMLFRYTIY